ncbi:uncharacterized protein I303_108521 [Kwoniella dejecticola CBS 10117]|uniref:Uncharacterized protein n=1 Tax=Kwoniella dejecticola CBS 10117 TaxID=1296121 RepID=A0A1A5ZX65_9TREE|nr:uncharacterized protein I303_07155 [Kwoniella dejecticola CBS 10117]OBR82396.1 hypothetical protein I303_07155 [Kwoniella dejecticola CBS 10117]
MNNDHSSVLDPHVKSQGDTLTSNGTGPSRPSDSQVPSSACAPPSRRGSATLLTALRAAMTSQPDIEAARRRAHKEFEAFWQRDVFNGLGSIDVSAADETSGKKTISGTVEDTSNHTRTDGGQWSLKFEFSIPATSKGCGLPYTMARVDYPLTLAGFNKTAAADTMYEAWEGSSAGLEGLDSNIGDNRIEGMVECRSCIRALRTDSQLDVLRDVPVTFILGYKPPLERQS